jgi:hypothetical protein
MTARDGFPRDMDLFALDALTAERLVTGAVDVGDAPPGYQGVARAFQALREAPDSSELLGASAAVDRIAAAVALERRARKSRRSRRSATRVARLAAASVVACGVALTGGLAAAGALPGSAQGVASAVLSRVGISVPTGGEEKPAEQGPRAPSSTSPAPPTTAGVTPAQSGNGPPAEPGPASSAPGQGDGEGQPGTRSHGTPPSTTKGIGKGQAPGGPGATNPGNGAGNRP